MDVLSKSEIAAVAREFPETDVLFNCAGYEKLRSWQNDQYTYHKFLWHWVPQTKAMLENVLLIFSHSYVHQGTIFDCDESAFDLSMNLNVKAMFLVTKEFVPEVSVLYIIMTRPKYIENFYVPWMI